MSDPVRRPAAPHPADPPGAQAFEVLSGDGTRLRAWQVSPGPGRTAVVLSSGLGAPPASFTPLFDPAGRWATVSWAHRGLLGSDRPADHQAVRVSDHVADLFAVMDAAGLHRALLVGWSIGVNIAAQAAVDRPDRVAGLLAVAGVPGGTFATMGAPLGVPALLRHPLAASTVRAAHVAGPVLGLASRGLLTRRFAPHLVRSTGFVLPTAGTAATRAVLTDFARHDWGWYMHMAHSAGHHEAIDPATITVPATLVGARLDVLTDWRAMQRVARAMPDARFRLVQAAGHFLPVEQPQVVLDELDLLAARCAPAP